MKPDNQDIQDIKDMKETDKNNTSKYLAYSKDNPLPYRQYRFLLLMGALFLAALVLGAGSCGAPGLGSGRIYILYMAVVSSMLLCCWFAGWIVKGGNPLKSSEWEKNGRPFKQASVGLVILCSVLEACYLVNLRNIDPVLYSTASAVSFPVFIALAEADALYLRHIVNVNLWKEIPVSRE